MPVHGSIFACLCRWCLALLGTGCAAPGPPTHCGLVDSGALQVARPLHVGAGTVPLGDMANNIILPGSGSSARGGGSGAVSATGATASASVGNPPSSASIGSASAASVSSAAGASGNSVALSLRSALAVLCGGKVARVVAAFATFRFLRGADGSPLFFYLFCVVAGASAVLLSLQRPWSGRRIGAKRWRKVRLTARARECSWPMRFLCVPLPMPADVCAFSSCFLV